MSLRRDIHNAFEVIAPPLGGMPERVVQTVLADKRRRRNSRMLLRLRAPLPLVAAMLAAVLVAAVIVGGRILNGSNALPQPAPASQPAHPGWPAGGPVPAQLQGDWYMPVSEANSLAAPMCPSPLSVRTCMFKLTLNGNDYYIDTNILTFSGGGGNVVVKGTEIDFFNGHACGMTAPQGIGRYTWNLSSGTLSFKELTPGDVCPREPWLRDQVYTRTGD